MKRYFLVAVAVLISISAIAQYRYDTVMGDPMKTRIYTLSNGLKVYLSPNHDVPRIYTAIPVRTGSMNDPSDNTGLSHYLEHMMFKGTSNFGTIDYQTEKIYLDQIESLFEIYRNTSDTAARIAIYRQIDSISGIAATYAIPNEYDKMLGLIGAKGTNAYTSFDQTVYINDIPSNYLKLWLEIEADRFLNPVFRLFHTELETVYEEKNMSLDEDGDKAWDALFLGLFPNHPYGTQTTIGSVEHLKNPSLLALKNYYRERYVPENMAICMAGDFDPDEVIVMIDETFGRFPASRVLNVQRNPEPPINEPVVTEVFGPDAEFLYLAFRLPGVNNFDSKLMTVTSMILSNYVAGLIDLDLNQGQKVLSAGAFPLTLNEYSAHVFYGYAKEGQKLEEVKDLILGEIEKVKLGDFPDWMLDAVITNMKLDLVRRLENNSSRVTQ